MCLVVSNNNESPRCKVSINWFTIGICTITAVQANHSRILICAGFEISGIPNFVCRNFFFTRYVLLCYFLYDLELIHIFSLSFLFVLLLFEYHLFHLIYLLNPLGLKIFSKLNRFFSVQHHFCVLSRFFTS